MSETTVSLEGDFPVSRGHEEKETKKEKKLGTEKANLRILFLKKPITWKNHWPYSYHFHSRATVENLLCSKAMLWECPTIDGDKQSMQWIARQCHYMRAR